MGRFVIWKNLNNNTYYYKYVKGYYYDYKIGLMNQYNHIVVLVIDLSEFVSPKAYSVSYRKKFINFLINFLKKFL